MEHPPNPSGVAEVADVLARTLPRQALSEAMDQLPDTLKQHLKNEDYSLGTIEKMLGATGHDIHTITLGAVQRILSGKRTPDHLFQYCNAALLNDNPFRVPIDNILTAIATARCDGCDASQSSGGACDAAPVGQRE